MDQIDIPITVVEQTVDIPITPDSPAYHREVDTEPSAKVSAFLRAAFEDLLPTDLVPVARPNVSTKATTLATLAQFLSQVAVGATLLQEQADAVPKRISELTQGQDLDGDEMLAIVQAGQTVRTRMLDIANYLKTVVGTGNVFSPVGLHYGRSVSAQQQAENTAIIQALHDSISPDFGGQGGVLYIPGIVKFGGLQRHPAVGLMGDGRRTTEWICADNCPYVIGTRRVAGVVTPNAQGVQRAMIYGLARAPFVPGQTQPTQATDAWFSMIRDVTLVGNKSAQSNNWVAGIYDEPGSADPNYQDVSGQGQEAKAYSGMYCENVEAYNFSGTGFESGGDRQRAYWHVCRSLNHGIVTPAGDVVTVARGWDIKGNDSLIGPRCGGGGSTDIAVVFSGPSGAGITQGNFWGGHDASASAATCVKARGCNGVFFVGNTWNANVCVDYGDGSSVARAVVLVGNRTQYDKTLFPVNTGEPIGLEQPNRNAAYTIIGYKQYTCRGNTVTAASGTNRTMLYLLWASEGATGGAQFDYSSISGVKPFAGATPIMTDTGASCTYEVTDVTLGRRYVNGQIINEGTSSFVAMYGGVGEGEERYTMAGSNITLLGAPAVYLTAPAEIASQQITLPAPRGSGHTIKLYTAQKIVSLQLLVTGQDAPTDGGTPQNITLATAGVPRFLLPGTTLQLRYNRAETKWYVNGLWNAEDPPSLKDPVRQYGAVMDGVKLNTTAVQQAFTDAKQAVAGFTYGVGGKVRFQAGVSLQGAIESSRLVGIEGAGGALAATVLRMDYTDRAGVPGEDAAIKVLDDGVQQASLVGQQKIVGLAIDGRVGQQPVGHLRHGIWYPAPAEGNTDRAPAVFDTHISKMPGAGWKITGNDQIRGVNIKVLDSEWGFDFDDVSDGKVDQIGLGGNKKGNRAVNCSSLKISKIDSWLDSAFNGDYLWQILSCSKSVFSDGEFEGPVLMTGDNHRVYNTPGLSDSKFAFQNGQNVLQNINFKVSTDYYTVKGAPPLAHLIIKDLHGTRLPGVTFGYKLGFTPSAAELQATPDYLIYFDTQLPSGNANYAAALANCGQVDVSDTSFIWHFTRFNAAGVPQTAAIVAAKQHVTNRPDRLVGLRIGVPKLKRPGTLAQNEILMTGQTLTSDKYPLLYLFSESGGTWARKLSDSAGAATFTLENLSAAAPAGWVYCCEFE